jgi:hypothetical protein
MKYKFLSGVILLGWLILVLANCATNKLPESKTSFFAADHTLLRYTGRIDFSDLQLPKFYQPASYVEAAFKGKSCGIIVADQQLWGNQNYLEVVIDGVEHRIQTNTARDTFFFENLGNGVHQLQVYKNTEANIGWVAIAGLICEKLVPLPPEPARRMEFIGNSITCGASADASEVPCHTAKWHDQHRAYKSYASLTARNLGASWHLSSVSGIGLIHSCCEMDVLMPPVYDNIDMRGDSLSWDFANYQPDVVSICLGQNDGIQDSVAFCSAYVSFIETIRSHHPQAQIVCLTSPMADDHLTKTLQNYLRGIVAAVHEKGDQKVTKFFFSKSYTSGCDTHPSVEEHALIAAELTLFLGQLMGW